MQKDVNETMSHRWTLALPVEGLYIFIPVEIKRGKHKTKGNFTQFRSSAASLSWCPRLLLHAVIIIPMERRPEPAPAPLYLERKTLNGDIPEVTQTWQAPNSFQIVH